MDVRKVLPVIIIVLFAFLVYAIPKADDGYEDTVRWNKTYKLTPGGTNLLDEVFDLATGPSRINSVYHNGTIYAVGYESNLSVGTNWRIRKYYRNGTEEITLWNKTIRGGDSSNSDYAYGVAVDSKGNVYVVGSFFNILRTVSGLDWNVKRFNASGSENITSWNKTFDVSNNAADALDVAIDSQDSVYVVGYSSNLVLNQSKGAVANLSGNDWLIKKFYFNGSEERVQWNKSFNSNRTNSDDKAYSVAIDSNDNVYVVGTGNQKPNNKSVTNWWIKKFNRSGRENVTHWNKTFNYNSSLDVARSVAVDSNNNIYVVGEIVRNSASYRWHIKKFYPNGSEERNLWNKTINNVLDVKNGIGNKDSSTYVPYSVDTDSSNNVYVVGSRPGGLANRVWWIKKFNASGRENVTYWNKTIGPDVTLNNDTYARAIVIDSANNITVGGVYNQEGLFTGDWWIKRFYTNVSVKPKVTITHPTNPINLCVLNISVNASVLDTDMGRVLFQFSNGTKPFNVTATNRSGVWEARVNGSRLVEEDSGVLRAQANDTRLGKNFTQIINYNHDCTDPTISLSESSSTEDSLSISISTSSDSRTCTSNQGTVSGSGSSQSIKASGLNPGTSYSFSVTCLDEAGNSASRTKSFSTAEASGSNGEGGDSEGGDSGSGDDSVTVDDSTITDESIEESKEGEPSESTEGTEGDGAETGEGEGEEGSGEVGESDEGSATRQAYEASESAIGRAVAQVVSSIGQFFRDFFSRFVGTGSVVADATLSKDQDNKAKVVGLIMGLIVLFSLVGYGTYQKYKRKNSD